MPQVRVAAPLGLVLALGFSGPASAQQNEGDTIPVADNAFSGDYVTVAAGGIYSSDYEGSDDYKIGPAAGFRGRVGGIRFFSRAIGVGVDLFPDAKGTNVKFTIGPVARYRANRSGKVKDRVVRLLPELKSTVEAGVTLGVSFEELFLPKDSLSFGSDVRWAVHNNKGGRIITTNVGYSTPISQAAGVGISFGMDHVNDKYADYNYSIDAAGSAASGLPVFQGKGGWKNWGTRAYIGYDLDGDLRNGGWAVGGALSYNRLIGSAGKTPITSIRGDRDQWMAGVGVGYTF